MNYPNLKYVHVFDTDEKGHRRMFVLTEGKKWVKLYCPFTCEGKRVMKSTYDGMLIEEEAISRRMLKILETNIKAFKDTTIRTGKLVEDLRGKLKGKRK